MKVIFFRLEKKGVNFLLSKIRHDKKKNYDASLPIHKDVLPHVFSILATLKLSNTEKIKSILWNEIKTKIEIRCNALDIEYAFFLEREGFERQRIIRVEAEAKTLELDFSKEPGFISNGESKVSADEDWNNKMRPLATMLSTFLNSISSQKMDSRLDASFALSVNEFADRIDKISI